MEYVTSDSNTFSTECQELEAIKLKKLLTIKETAQYLSIGESTLRKLLTSGEFRGCCVYIGKTVMFNRTRLDNYLDDNCF